MRLIDLIETQEWRALRKIILQLMKKIVDRVLKADSFQEVIRLQGAYHALKELLILPTETGELSQEEANEYMRKLLKSMDRNLEPLLGDGYDRA